MARTTCAALGLALVLLVGQAAYVHARDQVDVAGLPVEEQLNSYKSQAGDYHKQIQELEASKAKLQQEFTQNEVSVQTLQSVVKEQQRRVSALETELKNKDSAHGSLQTKLDELQATVTGASSGAQEDAVKAEAKVQDLQGRLKIAEQEKAAAEKAQQAAEKDSGNLQKEVDKAAAHVAKLTERVKKAEAGQIEAQNKLASAGVEASAARRLVEAAEAKAAEASAQAQEYYHKMTSSWTPHWLEARLNHGSSWVSRTLLADKSGKQNTVGQYVSIAKLKLAAFWKSVKNFLFHTNKQLGPHLTTAKKHSLRAWAQSKKHGWQAWLASKKHTNAFLASPQVKQAQKKVLRLRKDLESALRTQMKKYRPLQPYARKPYTTWILSVTAAVPVLVAVRLVLAVFGILGRAIIGRPRQTSSQAQRQKRTNKPSSSTSNASAAQKGPRTSRRASTGKIITEGDESIRVP